MRPSALIVVGILTGAASGGALLNYYGGWEFLLAVAYAMAAVLVLLGMEEAS